MTPTSIRREQGFTLIELLVVMIIISILMAVAVPTFLSQKNTALKTQATANIKNVVNAIESCGANIPTGGYAAPGAGGINCLDAETLVSFEKSLTNLNINPTEGGLVPGTFLVETTDSTSNQGYMVQTAIHDSGVPVYFVEAHMVDGAKYQLCGATQFSADTINTVAANTTDRGVAASKTCKTGTW